MTEMAPMRGQTMGERGPAPARSDERRRTNSPDHPIWKLGPDELAQLPFDIDLSPTPPPAPTRTGREDWKHEHPDSRWGPEVTAFYEAIKRDPMVAWMTAADWGALMIALEDLDRELKPQVVGISEPKWDPVLEQMLEAAPVTAVIPLKGGKLAALMQLFKAFGIGEANRLRMQKEITLFGEFTETIDADGDEIVETRLQLLQGGQSA